MISGMILEMTNKGLEVVKSAFKIFPEKICWKFCVGYYEAEGIVL